MSRLLLLMISGYQRFISPLLPPTCRFYPSCSEYARIALEKHGALHGSGLALWRLLRCGPWSKGGIDEVPAESIHAHKHS